MNSNYPPIPWSQFPAECAWYLVLMSVVHLAIFFVGCIVLVLVPRERPGGLSKRIGRLGLFLGVLLLVGSLVNGFWSCLIYNHLYRSFDYVFDFSPFLPVPCGNGMDIPLDEKHGQISGFSVWQLQTVWFFFASGTWAATIILYRLLNRRLSSNTTLGSTATAP
jgi:hypothetical protein